MIIPYCLVMTKWEINCPQAVDNFKNIGYNEDINGYFFGSDSEIPTLTGRFRFLYQFFHFIL